MIRDASLPDLPRLRELLVSANDAPYDISKVAEEKVFGAGVAGGPVVRIADDFSGVSVTCGKYLRLLAVKRDARRNGIGTALLRDAEARGASVIAAEPGNYFTPGIVSTDIASLAFFARHRYSTTADTQNLVARRLPDAAPSGVRSDRREEVLQFSERHFGSIWRYEADHGATLFHVETEGEIAGFSTHDANNRGLGFFGPTGVAERFRGRGYGRQLLLASLADLRRIGYTTVGIPWTDAIEFYRKSCGAEIAHRFSIMRRIAP